SRSTACISCSNCSYIRCRYCLVTSKNRWCSTSDRWWRYIHSPCNSLSALGSIAARISSTVSSGCCFCTANKIGYITNKSYSRSTACISCSNCSYIRCRYCLVTSKNRWCSTSDRWWRYIHSPCNSLSALSSIAARMGSTVSSGCCFCTANKVHNITNKSYSRSTACISCSNCSYIRCRYCLIAGKNRWCSTSDRWWRYIHSPCNSLSALGSIAARISSTVSSGCCFCTGNQVHHITNKSNSRSTACISCSNCSYIRCRYCLVTSKNRWCSTSDRWWCYIHSPCNSLSALGSIAARIGSTVSSGCCFCTANQVHHITNKSNSRSTACISCSNCSYIRCRYCLVTSKNRWCSTSDRWWRYIHSPCNSLSALSSIAARISSTVRSGCCFCTANKVHHITNKSYSRSTACISCSNCSYIRCRYCLVTSKKR